MAKTPFGADRGTATLKFDPDDIVIVTDPSHPRYDPRVERPLSEEFLSSLADGQLEPGIVFRNDDGKPEILNGRRRLRGYRELNKRRKPGQERYMFTAVYRTVGGDADAVSIRLQANLHEGDGIREKAETARNLMQRFGWTAARVGVCLGVGAKTVEKYLEVLGCAAPVLAALDGNRIGLGVAVELATLPKAKQIELLTEMQEGRPPREKGGSKSSKSKTGATKHGRPSTLTIRSVAAFAKETSMSAGERALLGWVLGEVTDQALVERWPQLASAFDRPVKTKAAA
jgi:ParB family chromosome partitioning protein